MGTNLQSILNINLGDEELFCEGGSEDCSSFVLGEEVVKVLRQQIVTDLVKKISAPQLAELSNLIKDAANIEAIKTLELEVGKQLDTVMISSSWGQVSAKVYIEKKIIDLLKDRSINEMLTKQAEKTVAELKEKYDMFYAMQLLKKMSQAGMLKDDSIVKDYDLKG